MRALSLLTELNQETLRQLLGSDRWLEDARSPLSLSSSLVLEEEAHTTTPQYHRICEEIVRDRLSIVSVGAGHSVSDEQRSSSWRLMACTAARLLFPPGSFTAISVLVLPLPPAPISVSTSASSSTAAADATAAADRDLHQQKQQQLQTRYLSLLTRTQTSVLSRLAKDDFLVLSMDAIEDMRRSDIEALVAENNSAFGVLKSDFVPTASTSEVSTVPALVLVLVSADGSGLLPRLMSTMGPPSSALSTDNNRTVDDYAVRLADQYYPRSLSALCTSLGAPLFATQQSSSRESSSSSAVSPPKPSTVASSSLPTDHDHQIPLLLPSLSWLSTQHLLARYLSSSHAALSTSTLFSSSFSADLLQGSEAEDEELRLERRVQIRRLWLGDQSPVAVHAQLEQRLASMKKALSCQVVAKDEESSAGIFSCFVSRTLGSSNRPNVL